MTQPSWVPAGIDLTRPSVARVYDYLLGGFHNFPADRELAEATIAASPLVAAAARAGRAFLARAVTHLAVDRGIRQFLDLGSGIPTEGNVHDIVQAVDPTARVVYVDTDPVAVAHGEAILADNPCAIAVQGDLRRPQQILSHPEVAALLDPAEPTAVLMMLVLHFVGDDEGPADLVQAYRDALAPGSWLALSHATDEFHPKDLTEGVTDLYARTPTPLHLRGRDQVLKLFDGWTLVEPGLVLLEQWRPERLVDVEAPERFPAWAGVAQA